MATATQDIFRIADETMPPDYRTKCGPLDERLSRCHKTLNFIACRIVADSELAARAAENCRLKVSLNPPAFENEGAFGSWVLRLLIDEALSIS
jgi:hypothetical protein